jgi:1-acyl-sn-glycerol-3-phosphate acyltransferase
MSRSARHHTVEHSLPPDFGAVLPLPDREFLDSYVATVFAPLRLYHRYELRYAERLPRHGPVLLVCQHSVASYDLFLLALGLLQATGRCVRALGHKQLWFLHPRLARLSERLGVVAGTPDAGQRLLAAGELVAVAPGGAREALRPSTERFQVSWQGRTGFARLAMQTGAQVVLAATPAADRIFTVYDNPLTRVLYERFRIAPALLRGLGPTLIPRPVKLISYLSEPIEPPRGELSESAVESFRSLCEQRMKALIAEGVREEGLP